MNDPLIKQLLDTPCNGEQARVFAGARSEIEKLRSTIEAIHNRVCNGATTHDMGEEIAAKCQAAVPGLREKRR